MGDPSLPTQWQHWIAENIARGCTNESMLEAMAQAQLDPASGHRAIAQQRARRANEQAMPTALGERPAAAVSYATVDLRLRRSGHHIATTDHNVEIVMQLTQPHIALLANVLTAQECDELVALARRKLRPSTIVDPTTGTQREIADRSSQGTFFAIDETPFISKLDRRISELMNWPVQNGEGLQILQYRAGGEYKPHFDYFPPDDPGSLPHLQHGGQRISSLIIYLNDVQGGGETIFPDINLAVVPRKGTAVYFEYCDAQGRLDPQTLHGGAPVREGEKWIATKWMRQYAYRHDPVSKS